MAVFNRLTLIKLVELCLAIAIFWLHYNTFESEHVKLFVESTTFMGFLVVVVGTFLGLITGSPVNKTVDMYFCVAGAVLYIASGSLTIQHFQGWTFRSSVSNMGLTKGSLAIIQGVIFLIDGFFTFKAE
uniref:Unkown protein n=1 Tax=Riptortus pedestris TaxID=329032 RepID=R4WK14_RIPPE|nr:unkown protein [Riptortus pedestris]